MPREHEADLTETTQAGATSASAREATLVVVQDHVAEITINRPEALNALDPAAMERLQEAFRGARDDARVRAIVLRGQGERAFCVGADLKNTAPPPGTYAQAFLDADAYAARRGVYGRNIDLARLDLWKPIVVSVAGHCLGGGLELALQGDVIIAARSATFGLPEVVVGTIPGVCGVPALLDAVPRGAAMRLLLTGERISAEEAHRIGLVTELRDTKAEADERSHALARQMAANAPLAVQAIKRLAAEHQHLSTRTRALSELVWGVLRDTQDRLEGRRAFAERRPPVFEGR